MEMREEHDFSIQGKAVDRAERTLTIRYGWEDENQETFALAEDWFVVDGDKVRAVGIVEDNDTKVITDLEEWSPDAEAFEPAPPQR